MTYFVINVYVMDDDKYNRIINELFNRLPMYQRIGKAAYKANLNNSLILDKYFDSPHKHYRTIHIAGTNGKGSVSSMITSILMEAGYKTGLYTSPHLLDFRERIRVNGNKIEREYIVDFIEQNKSIINEINPSFFELTVALAFKYFKEQAVDIAVIEVGMGGRLDSTNIINPILSVITNISLDHTKFLGNTLEQIANEKAGIIKDNVPVIIGRKQPEIQDVFIKKAIDKNSAIYFAQDCYFAEKVKNSISVFKENKMIYNCIDFDLKGDYQLENIVTAICAIDKIKEKDYAINKDSIIKGLKNIIKNTGIQGRWQILRKNPIVICDTGHNEDGIKQIVKQLKDYKYDKLHIVIGVVNDKDYNKLLKLLPVDAKYYFTKANIPRALDPQILKTEAEKVGLHGDIYESVKTAYHFALINAKKNDLIFIGGSTFVVADIIS